MESSAYTELRKEYPKEWRIWYVMNRRCETDKTCYVDVEVCDEWSRKVSGEEGFINWLDAVGPRPTERHDFTRKDTFGDWTYENSHWTPREIRNHNQRWHQTEIADFRRQAYANGITRHQWYGRLARGWDPRDAATLPPEKTKYRNRLV